MQLVRLKGVKQNGDDTVYQMEYVGKDERVVDNNPAARKYKPGMYYVHDLHFEATSYSPEPMDVMAFQYFTVQGSVSFDRFLVASLIDEEKEEFVTGEETFHIGFYDDLEGLPHNLIEEFVLNLEEISHVTSDLTDYNVTSHVMDLSFFNERFHIATLFHGVDIENYPFQVYADAPSALNPTNPFDPTFGNPIKRMIKANVLENLPSTLTSFEFGISSCIKVLLRAA